MTKEEIKAMIDATINENGERNITGKALNLALNAIVDAMGEGGGLDTIYLLPSSMNPDAGPMALDASELPFTEEEFMAMIAHNQKIYNKITEKFNTTKNASTFVFDFSVILSMEAGVLYGYNVGIKNVVYMKIEEQIPNKLSFNPYDYYNAGETVVLAELLNNELFGGSQQIAILPNGYCEIISNAE
jgi:hypothetical protein